MRHLWSLLAGIVSAPLVWLLLSSGQHRSQAVVASWDATGRFNTADLVGPVILLAVAGIMLGLLGTLRWSPAGPVVAGALFVTPTVLMFINPFQTLEGFFRPSPPPADIEPRRILAQDLEPWLPVENGTLLVLGVLLLMAVFSGQRWRRWPAATTAPAAALAAPARSGAATDEEVIAGITALGGGKREPVSITDDEILAAAAALDGLPEPTPPATERPGAGPDAGTSSDTSGTAGTSGSGSPADDRPQAGT